MSKFTPINLAIEHIKQGKPLIIVDDETRENEGDLFIPSDKATPEIIHQMIKHAGGLVCCSITRTQASRLNLPLMIAREKNTEKTGVNFTVSVNAADGTTTGVSAFDRAKTISVMSNPESIPADLERPGHVFGLISRDGGVLERDGQTEASVDLARLADFNPSGVICEIVGKSGEMAQYDELKLISRQLDAPIVSVADLKTYLGKNPLKNLQQPDAILVAESKLPTSFGEFNIAIFKNIIDNTEHSVLSMGNIGDEAVVRMHSMCLTGDTFGSQRCDCQKQLHDSMARIAENGSGILLYLNQEGRGIGLENKIKAYALQDKGYDTVEANCKLGLPIDARDYKVAADILKSMGIKKVSLLTNNPDKIDQLQKHGIIVSSMSHETEPNSHNSNYLKVKKQKLGHKLSKV